MRELAALAILLAASVMVNAAFANGQPLLLEVWLNGHTQHQVLRVEAISGELLASAPDLENAGVRLDNSEKIGQVSLSHMSGLHFTVDSVNQRLLISAKPDRLREQSFDLLSSANEVPKSVSSRGASLAYDFSGTANDIGHIRDSSSLGGTFGLNFFATNILFPTTGFATENASGSSGARLDTSLEFDDPSLPRRIIFGDAINGSLSWSRAIRFGGIELASDYSLRPDLITFPLPSFFGRASVPETVDVLVDSAKVFEQDIEAGPFALHDLPIVTGGGSATVVTTDVLGRETEQTVSLYTTTQLLASGLTDYSVDAGFMRAGYGEQSFDYRTPIASLVYRHGLDGLTVGTHAEVTSDLELGGGEVAFSLGDCGALSAAAAYSHSVVGSGALAAVNFQGRVGAVNGFASVQATSSRYQDIAGLEDGAPAHLRVQFGASTALPYGSLGVSWVRESQSEQGASDEAIASYSLSVGNNWFVGLTGLRDFSGHSWSAQIFLGIPIADGVASASYSGGTGRPTALAQFDSPADPDGGAGYSLAAGTDPSGQHFEGDATWVGQHATLDGGLATDGGEVAMRGGASGSLVLVGNNLFAARQSDGAFALVQTGAADVRIYRDNREVATTGDDGEALLSGLVPYTENHLSIDPRDYPMQSVVATTEQTVVPQKSAAVTVDLAPHLRHPALVIVRFMDGVAPPLQTIVTQSLSDDTLMVGRDGEIFIPDLPKGDELSLALGDQSCTIRVDMPAQTSGAIPRIGPLLCLRGVPA